MFLSENMCKCWITMHVNMQVELLYAILIWHFMNKIAQIILYCPTMGKLGKFCSLIESCMCWNSVRKDTEQCKHWVWYFLKYILRLARCFMMYHIWCECSICICDQLNMYCHHENMRHCNNLNIWKHSPPLTFLEWFGLVVSHAWIRILKI
jgi:hypothetical protein